MPASPIFKKVLTQPSDVATQGLQNTMSEMSISAPGVNPVNPTEVPPFDVGPYDKAVKDAEEQLNTILGQYPSVDYEGKYKEILDSIKNRPTTPDPLASTGGALANFAYAMGAPDKAPALIHEKVQQSHNEAQQKHDDVMKLQEELLKGTIQQEMAKGNFKLALSQSEKLMDIQRANADRERALNMNEWREKQRIKTTDARTLLKQKIANMAATYHLDEKMQLAVLNHGFRMLELKGLLTPEFEDVDMATKIGMIMPDVVQYAREATHKRDSKTTTLPPKIDTTIPPTPSSKLGTPDLSTILKQVREGRK